MRRTNVSRAIAALLGITLLFAAGTQKASTAGPDVVRVGRAVSTAFAFAVLEVGNDAHTWDKVGLKLEISTFKGDADVQRAMTANQIDFGLGGGPAIVYRVDGKRRGPTSVRVGYVLPLWRSAAGRVFLAYLPERDTAALLHEEDPQVTAAELAAEVERIRKNGFAITGDADEFSGIAAPVLDHDGQLVAALALSRPYDENTRDRRMQLGAVVRDAAAFISKQLGHAHETAAQSVSMKGSPSGLGKTSAANRI